MNFELTPAQQQIQALARQFAREEVEPLAYDPLYRWVTDAEGTRWEVRMVVSDPPTRQLVKFVCWGAGVYEGAYPYDNGLGLRTDAELRDLLAELKRAPSS